MSKLGLTETQHQKLAKLLDDTYPQGDIIKADTSAMPSELGKAVAQVQQKVDELRDAIRDAEDVLKKEEGSRQ